MTQKPHLYSAEVTDEIVRRLEMPQKPVYRNWFYELVGLEEVFFTEFEKRVIYDEERLREEIFLSLKNIKI